MGRLRRLRRDLVPARIRRRGLPGHLRPGRRGPVHGHRGHGRGGRLCGRSAEQRLRGRRLEDRAPARLGAPFGDLHDLARDVGTGGHGLDLPVLASLDCSESHDETGHSAGLLFSVGDLAPAPGTAPPRLESPDRVRPPHETETP
ncbi:hypothetical protein FRIGORI9N_110014 [Frigoribacterium sp. 9N]|nr:hypothetical protein FRIGORI9N_110014 [Frigoribacterium sp. 9N]